jgi:hypothetical protein
MEKKMRIRTLPAVSILLVVSAWACHARGQANILDVTRTVTDSGTLDGISLYSNSDSDSDSGAFFQGFIDDPSSGSSFFLNSSAIQNSVISPSEFDIASASAGTNASILAQTFEESDDASAQTTLNIDFNVSTPTPFSISGTVSAYSEIYYLYGLETLTSTLSLTGSNEGVMYSTGEQNVPGPTDTTAAYGEFSDLVTFSTVLQPGDTYTLTATASADSPRSLSSGDNTSSYSEADFSFIAVVPEPASGGILLAIGGWVLSRRRMTRWQGERVTR